MPKHLTSTLAAALAVLGLASAAPAVAADSALPLPSDARFAVAPGKIEHTVKIDKVSGPNAIPSHTKTEQWLASDRSRTVVTDLRTGRLRAETVVTPTEIRTYNASERVVRVEPRRRGGGLPVNSFTFEAAIQRIYLERGYVRVVGEKQVGGRRALVTENVAGGRWKSDPADTRTVAVVDAETFTLYERTTSHPRGEFVHRQEFPVVEVLDATPQEIAATLAMKQRKGVEVRGKGAKAGAASDAALVPAGKVEHTVVVRTVRGSRAVASRERTERWLTRTGSRTVVTDLETGRVRTEIVTSPYETRIYDRAENRVTVTRHGRQAPPYRSAASEAVVQRTQLEQGRTRVIGEKAVGGRRALVVESVPGRSASDEPQSRTVATIDAETHALYERTTGLPDGAFSQTEVHELTELLPLDAKAKARLAMAEHRGAKVVRR